MPPRVILSEKETATLCELWGVLSLEDLSARMGVGLEALRRLATEAGLPSKQPTGGWPEEHIAVLLEMWPQGFSASQVTHELARRFPTAQYSRAAIIGKLHRLGMQGAGRQAPTKPQVRSKRLVEPRKVAKPSPRAKPRAAITPVFATEPLPPERDTGPGIATILTVRDSMCKFPIGDPADPSFTVCGRHTEARPYCPEHHKVAYVPAQARKKTSASELARSLRRYI